MKLKVLAEQLVSNYQRRRDQRLALESVKNENTYEASYRAAIRQLEWQLGCNCFETKIHNFSRAISIHDDVYNHMIDCVMWRQTGIIRDRWVCIAINDCSTHDGAHQILGNELKSLQDVWRSLSAEISCPYAYD
ncbi:MAG: hypothetical protein WCK71_02850 [bacterium]